MNKKYAKVQSTRRSLIMSILSLMLCFTMLIGTTYAWFTDSVTSGKNKIVAGNLDIELEYLDGEGNWNPVTESTKLFDENALWEPGYTEVAYLKLSNKGTLALKYNFVINIANEVAGTNMADDPFKLSDYIKMGVVDNWDGTVYANRAAARAAVSDAGNIATYTKEGDMLAGADALTFAIVAYMPEEVGNVANYKTGTTAPSIEMGVKLVATQLASEKDSFGTDYDATAVYPATEPEEPVTPPVTPEPGTVVDEEGVKAALSSDEPVKLGGDVTMDVTEVDISQADINLNGHTLTIINATVSSDPTADIKIHGDGKIKFATENGGFGVYAGKISFSDCTIVVEQGATITEANASTTISFNNVVFDCRSDTPALWLGNGDTLTMTSCSEVAGSKDIYVQASAVAKSISVNGSTVTLPDGGGKVSLPVAE